MHRKLFRSGTVVTPAGSIKADVLVGGDKILDVAPSIRCDDAQDIDCSDRLLLPGLVDAHVHFRDPGLTRKEDFVSGTTAAVLGGITTALVMPTDEPYTATEHDFAEKAALTSNRLRCDVGMQVAIRRNGQALERVSDCGPVSYEVFTADVPEPFLHDDLAKVQEALARVAQIGAVAGISPGDQSLLSRWNSLPLPRRVGFDEFCQSRPPAGEAMGIARAIVAASSTGCRIHIRQINSRAGVELVRRLKDLCDVTVETTVQCLLFDKRVYETQGPLAKGSPPFRASEDVAALRAAVRSGLIDIVATDHAPHTLAEKKSSYETFADVPGGMPGVQTFLPAMLHLVSEGVLSLEDLVRACSLNPAERFGFRRRKGGLEQGYDADILVVDPARGMQIRNEDQISKAGYTIFNGLQVPMALDQVYLRGVLVVDQRGFLPGFHGELLKPAA
jgi:dihydroorotase